MENNDIKAQAKANYELEIKKNQCYICHKPVGIGGRVKVFNVGLDTQFTRKVHEECVNSISK